jgi:hypothetical protein
MNKNQEQEARLTQIIIELIQNKQPQNVQQLVNLVKEKTSLSEKIIVDHINLLQSQNKIRLNEQPQPLPQKLSTYIGTKKAYWYWTTLLLAIVTATIIFMFPEEVYPLVYIRYILGTIFVMWLPGYSFIKALFPIQVPIKTSSKNLDYIERIALSAGMNLALVPFTGLILNYTPWGIRVTPVTLSLLILIIVFATVAIVREYYELSRTSSLNLLQH